MKKLFFTKYNTRRLCLLMFLFILSSFIQLPAQNCIDGSYCPLPPDPAGNACDPDVVDEYENALNELIDPNASGSCEIIEVWVDADFDNIYFALTRGNQGTGLFTFYINTDCDITTGDLALGGADLRLIIKAGNNGAISIEGIGEWNGTDYDNAVASAGMAATGMSDGCGGSLFNFIELSIPISELFDPCEINECSSIGITHIITNSGGSLNSSLCVEVDLDFTLDINEVPVAAFSVMPSPGCLGTAVILDGTLSIDTIPLDDSLSYFWDIDFDGVTFDVDYTDSIVSHVYAAPGCYQVALIVEDKFGCRDSLDNLSQEVKIFQTPVAMGTVVGMDCSFAIDYDATGSQDFNAPDNLSYLWDFGDGNTSTTISGTHTYTSCSSYEVVLIVTDPDAQMPCVSDTLEFPVALDTEDPTITCPPDLGPLELCLASDLTAALAGFAFSETAVSITTADFIAAGGTVSDNCGVAAIEYIDVVVDSSCPNPLTVERTFTVLDDCDLTATCVQILSIEDITPPTITCPTTIEVECISDVPLPDITLVTASDNCSAVTTSHIGDVSDGLTCPETITRTYQATDVCGNAITCEQLILINDLSLPTITCPADVTIMVDALCVLVDTTIADLGAPIIADNCDLVTFSYVDDLSGLNGCTDVACIIRTFTATDACGNSLECDQKITVQPQLGSLSGLAWEDQNFDGMQTPGEPFIPGIVVYLHDMNGVVVATSVTDAVGAYLFEDLPPGNYYVEFSSPGVYDFTSADVGIDTLDSDVNFVNGTGTTSFVSVVAGAETMHVDAGYVLCAIIGDLVWYDANMNDIQDPGENGINNVLVKLYRNVSGVWLFWDETYTGLKPGTPSDDGWFKFCAPPGDYYLEIGTPLAGLVLAQVDVGTNEEIDNDFANFNGPATTDVFELTPAGKCDLAAGYYPQATAGDRVWLDANGNGMQDANEPKIDNVLIEAIDMDGNVVQSDVSDSDGDYIIASLQKQDYYFKITPPIGFAFTSSNNGDDAMDSDVTGANGPGTTDTYSTYPGDNLENIDVGLISGVILPVHYKYFIAEQKDKSNILNWLTTTEVNNSHFEIERKIENSTFEKLGVIHAVEDPSFENHYQYIDRHFTKTGHYYYRLRQVDKDGDFSYSDIVQLNVKSVSNSVLSIFPNPTSSSTVKLFTPFSSDKLEIRVFSMDGNELVHKVLDRNSDKLFDLNVQDLVPGVYLVKAKEENVEMLTRLIILK